jgi:hypothetical protein
MGGFGFCFKVVYLLAYLFEVSGSCRLRHRGDSKQRRYHA